MFVLIQIFNLWAKSNNHFFKNVKKIVIIILNFFNEREINAHIFYFVVENTSLLHT